MRKTVYCCILLLAAASGLRGLVQSPGSPLPGKARTLTGRTPVPVLRSVRDLPTADRGRRLAELDRLGVSPGAALFDRTSSRWAVLRPALPLIPGNGVGNDLEWSRLGTASPEDDEALGRAAWARLVDYLRVNADALSLDTEELEPRRGVFDAGNLIQFSVSRRVSGLPVRGATLTAVISHGNLVLLGTRDWADLVIETTPSIFAESAVRVVADHVGSSLVRGTRTPPWLTLLPLRDEDPTSLRHRLAWVVEPVIPSDPGRWEALVDAHDGELLALQDLNHYGTARNIRGGVYPASTDGIEPDGSLVAGYPMPYADLDVGGFADSGGNFAAAGLVTTTLSGQFVRIVDACGAISESGSGDIDLEGTDGDTDCDVPPGHSAGDTAAARTAYYELNRIREMAAGQLPGNPWLSSQLTANTNIDATCGAFWNGTSVSFFRNNGGPCENPAQLAGVIDHEWGHGMDDNDVGGGIPSVGQGGGEGLADLMAALRGNVSCIGRGSFTTGSFCSGYGDPCTAASGCTGVRTVDYAERLSGQPHDLTWIRAFCFNDAPQCLGAAYSEAVWDLAKRDLPALYGMDDNTAMEVTRRLLFLGGGNLTGWFDLDGPAPGDAGCGAGQAYLQFLAADDDDGDIDNGTPHMRAIAAAFDRLEIGCTPGGATPGPLVQDSGCASTPTSAPTVSAAATDMGALLTWMAVPDAAEYRVLRTDGERECDLGKALVGTTSRLEFTDQGLQNGRPYSYVVIPMGVGGASCFGPSSFCATVGEPLIFVDGFESGDTEAWSVVVP